MRVPLAEAGEEGTFFPVLQFDLIGLLDVLFKHRFHFIGELADINVLLQLFKDIG